MKKRIVALVIIICILAALFAGCDEIFKKNDRRDFEQSIAAVDYSSTVKGKASYQAANVMKGEFALSFNNSAQQYVQYYGMTYQQAASYILNSMAQRELLVLFAKSYVIENNIDGLNIDKVPENCSIRELLTPAEIEKAIISTNADLKTALDNLIAELIKEEERNKPVEPVEEVEDSSKDPVTFKVIFDTKGGDSFPSYFVGQGKKVVNPGEPSKTGYTFGYWKWATGEKAGQKFDFATDVITARTTLEAVWFEYTAPRAVMPKEEKKEEEFDPFKPVATFTPYFFDEAYLSKTNGYITFEDEKYWDKKYFDNAIEQLKKNLAGTFRGYDYYLNSEFKTVLLEKFNRAISSPAKTEQGLDEKVQAEYDRAVKANRESFAVSDANYEKALKETLSATYFHKFTDPAYGFTNNILLKFGQDELKYLTDAVTMGTSTTTQIKALRDSIARSMTIKVSNADYNADEAAKNPLDLENNDPDPLTNEDYNKIITFEKTEAKDGWQIVYNAKDEANRAFLRTEWPAFTTGEKVGIVNQIKATLDSVVAARGDADAPLSYSESIYWLRKVTMAWLYLVGDDEGGTKADSNNNGLGYLVSAEGKSGFIDEYETQSRALIGAGTGSYSTDGTVDGSYVVGDNFIDENSTSSAYAGIFFVFVSSVPFDPDFYEACGGTDKIQDGHLPLDYIITVAEDEDDSVTIYDSIKENILKGRESELYSIFVNNLLNNRIEGNKSSINYNQKVLDAFFKK